MLLRVALYLRRAARSSGEQCQTTTNDTDAVGDDDRAVRADRVVREVDRGEARGGAQRHADGHRAPLLDAVPRQVELREAARLPAVGGGGWGYRAVHLI